MMMMAQCTFCTRKYTHTLISRVLCIVQFATRAILTAFHSLMLLLYVYLNRLPCIIRVALGVCTRVCVLVCVCCYMCYSLPCICGRACILQYHYFVSPMYCNVHAFHDQKLVRINCCTGLFGYTYYFMKIKRMVTRYHFKSKRRERASERENTKDIFGILGDITLIGSCY